MLLDALSVAGLGMWLLALAWLGNRGKPLRGL